MRITPFISKSIRENLKLCMALLALCFMLSSTSCGGDDGDGGGAPDPDPVEAYEQYGPPFDGVPEAADVVMYEVNLRGFDPSGRISAVTNRLDHLASMGVNVIWLMPVYPIGEINSVNSPYSVKDYKAVASEYGTFEDLRTLTDQAHARGIAVILDWVANHTSWDNDWIENKSWYTQDASGNIIHPAGTNWQDVADLNFNNEDMRAAMIDAMKYWVLEANVDGFRCDYADGVPFDFWKQAIDSLEEVPDREYVMLAEGARVNHISAGFDLNFSWSYYGALKEVFDGDPASRLVTAHQEEYSGLPTGGQRLRFTTNHDESAWDATPMMLFGGKEGALAASVVTTYLGGAPLIYTGQEVGREATLPFFSRSTLNWNANPDMLAAYKQIMTIYSENEVARKGSNTYYHTDDVMAFIKTYNGEELLVVVNLRNQTETFEIPTALADSQWTNALDESTLTLSASLELGAFEYIILKK